MPDNRLQPILRIRNPLGEPSHESFSLFATSTDRIEEVKRSGGLRNVIAYELGEGKSFTRQFRYSDEEDDGTANAVSLPYALISQNEYSRIGSFETIPTPQEQEQLNSRLAYYEALRDPLEQQLADGEELSPEDEQLLDSYRNNIDAAKLAQGIVGNQSGFIEEIPDIFGYGGTCLHDLNNVPNIHKIRRSSFALPANRPWHLALRFSVPNEDQAETSHKAKWGPFTLEWRGGRSVILTMYSYAYYGRGEADNLARISEEEARLASLKDQGRITEEDAIYIEEKETQIRELRHQVKELKLKKTDAAYLTFYNNIQTLKKDQDDRRKLKARVPGAVLREIEEIEERLYQIHERTVNLNESSENFYGDEGIVRLTVLPQRRGFLTLVLNGQE